MSRQLEAGFYAFTIRVRLRTPDNSAWEPAGWQLLGTQMSASLSPPEINEIRAINRTDEGVYGADVLRFSDITQAGTYTITLDNPSMAVLGLSFQASTAEVSQSSGAQTVSRSAPAELGYVHLDYRNVSSVVVTRSNGDGASAWITLTPYSLGDFLADGTHFYECTTAGTSGASEPTWPTDGTTVTDGSAVWLDRGTIIAAATTDYVVHNAADGVLVLPTGTRIVAGEPLSVAFDAATTDITQMQSGQTVDRYGQLRLTGYNKAKPGQRLSVLVAWAHLVSPSEVSLTGEGLVEHTVEVTPLQYDPAMTGLELPHDWVAGNHSRVEVVG